ncbi:MAG: hypothetical protein ACR2PQ_00920 [Myxococcota bacterium]
MREIAGLNRWEQRYCRQTAFGKWRDAEWMRDAMSVFVIAVGAWAIHSTSADAVDVSMGFVVGITAGALVARNFPVRVSRVVSRLTRALEPESTDQAL